MSEKPLENVKDIWNLSGMGAPEYLFGVFRFG